MKIAVLITCFNRKEKTVKCLQALKKQLDGTDIDYDVHLTDDGCTDGTAEAVLHECPNATIYKGGNLFWAGGMRLCWAGALEKGGYDYYLLLNDDTFVNDHFVTDFLECHKYGDGECIIRGNTIDPVSKSSSYPSFVMDNRLLFKFHTINPTGKPTFVDVAGANIMFIPDCIVKRIGIFPQIYRHAIADFDYCFRSRKAGFKLLQTSNYCGECEIDHSFSATGVERKKMRLFERWHFLFSQKGLEIKQYLYYQWCFFPWRVPFVIGNTLRRLFFGW